VSWLAFRECPLGNSSPLGQVWSGHLIDKYWLSTHYV
jgi:hypothetical protein